MCLKKKAECGNPTTNGGMQNGSSAEISSYTLHAHFCTFGADAYAQSVLSNKISASKLRRKFIKSVLVGKSHIAQVTKFSDRQKQIYVRFHVKKRKTDRKTNKLHFYCTSQNCECTTLSCFPKKKRKNKRTRRRRRRRRRRVTNDGCLEKEGCVWRKG